MSILSHRLGLTINALFLVAGCVSTLTDEALYRVAIVAIIFLLRLLWTKALIQRAARRALTTYRSARQASALRIQASDRTGWDVVAKRR